ncbi:uncharacterized protein LOC123549694 [Mercenaria mercenaria]|uniref:uncharacterized protein LOC123549694 n=1 Tax=Mercenaria mercenaria TaxID=6596 RepID=UPI00234EB26F|nr:uncharacterized protein LOC123549694 [Mercenaria mercenaria]XP_053401035.1 uncharacterized protein LOC123549694 [Mercenaria mercenaria]
MEYLHEEIKKKVCVDFENEEIQDIMKAVDILMNRFINELTTKFPSTKIDRLALCGSMAEQTRLWRGSDDRCDLEFDYLAILKSFPGCEDFFLEHSIDGQMEVKYKIVNLQSKEFVYVNLNPEVKFVFACNFHTCINEKCRQNSCALSLRTTTHMIDSFSGCQFCSVCMKTGELKCIQTSLHHGRVNNLHHLDRLRFLWISKNRLLSIPSASNGNCDIFRQIKSDWEYSLRNRFEFTLPELPELSDKQPEAVSIEVDFHPVLEVVDADVVQRLVRCFRWWGDEKCVLFQNIYTYSLKNRITAVKAQQLCLNMPSKILRLAYFTLKILAISNQWKFKKIPLLEKKPKYVLFPKGYIYDNKLWRVSTCQSELEILKKTSKEHRLAFCFLKFLAMEMKEFDRTFPTLNQYEAKIAVINHINGCKSPAIGAHVCALNILNDIVRCRSVKLMNHPFLQLNLYDMVNLYEENWQFIHFKVLLLVLVNRKGKYAITDLHNDLISVWLVSYTFKYGITPANYDFTRPLLGELREICKRRKMQTSSRTDLIKVISSLLRTIRLKKNSVSNVEGKSHCH